MCACTKITSNNDGGGTGEMGGGGGEGGKGQSTCKPLYTASYNGTKGMGKFPCQIKGSLYRKPQFHEFLAKQAKCSLY